MLLLDYSTKGGQKLKGGVKLASSDIHGRASGRPMLDNQWYLKVIGDKIKLTHLYSVAESGWEAVDGNNKDTENLKLIMSDKKTRRSLMRARNKVFEYAYCNQWDFFFTGTIDGNKLSRSDLENWEKKFTQMIRNLRRKGYDIQYLIIPELHADLENWHCHGLLKGLPVECLKHFKDNKYNWIQYEKLFGFNSLEPIRCHEAVSKYLTKYITKTFNQNRGVTDVGKKLYLVSNGLQCGELKRKGSIAGTIERVADFENDFCQIFNFDISELDYLLSLYEN